MNQETGAGMRDIFVGIIGIAVGGLLALYGDGVDMPAIDLDKLGVIVLAIGALDLLYGVFRVATRSRRAT